MSRVVADGTAGGVAVLSPDDATTPVRTDDDESVTARDIAAMKAWTSGSAEAFDILHHAYRDRLWRYVIRAVGNEDTARELYQDIWMRVIDRRNDWQPTGRFVGWLFSIARHRVSDHFRAAGRQPDIDTDAKVDDTAEASVTALVERPLGPEERAALAEDDARLQRALDCLPGEQREAVLMHHVAGLTLAEISDATGTAREAVKSRLRYAVRRLRKRLRTEPLDNDRRIA